MTGALEFIDFCRPVLTHVCGYWCARRAGAEPSAEQVRRELRSDFAVLKRRAAEDERSLEICEAVVEPLIFFVDYTLKEGGFSFSGAWREMARDFNELSGDEKFFDYLEELRRPAKKGDAAEDDNLKKAAFYFLLLGLGFDGMHRTERLRTLGLMEHLSGTLTPALTVLPERWTPEPRPVGEKAGRQSLPDFLVSSDFALIAVVCAALFALAALFCSVQVLRGETAGFSRTIEAALEATGLHNAAVSAPMQSENPQELQIVPEPAAAPEKLPLLPKLTPPEPAPQWDGSVLRIN